MISGLRSFFYFEYFSSLLFKCYNVFLEIYCFLSRWKWWKFRQFTFYFRIIQIKIRHLYLRLNFIIFFIFNHTFIMRWILNFTIDIYLVKILNNISLTYILYDICLAKILNNICLAAKILIVHFFFIYINISYFLFL